VVNTGHGFVREGPPDAAALVSRSVSVAPYRFEARVRMHASALTVSERVPPTVATIEEVDGSTCLLVTGADDLDAIAVHLAMIGVDFEVLAPPELRDRLAVLAARLAHAAATTPVRY
jgi:predicted DNA-binding transcriptional regulator YafY